MKTCSKCQSTENDFPKTGAVCKPCDSIRKKAWYEHNHERELEKKRSIHFKNREENNARSRAYYRENAETILAKEKEKRALFGDGYREYRKEHYRVNRELYLERDLFKKYGITRAQWEEMLREQGGVCAICRGGPGRRHGRQEGRDYRFAVDHDHATGRIRGLLCHKCNLGLGYFQDSPEYLNQAANYLHVHNSRK